MIYARQPTDEERKELNQMVRQAVGRVSQRAQMVLLSIRRKKVPEIADLFQVCEPTVRYWLRRYDVEGPVGLYDRVRSGRPSKITQEVKDTIIQMMQTTPEQEGYRTTLWTVAVLAMALTNRLKTAFSLSVIRRTLHQIELRWGRPRLDMPQKTDPEKAQKQWVIVKAVVTLVRSAA